LWDEPKFHWFILFEPVVTGRSQGLENSFTPDFDIFPIGALEGSFPTGLLDKNFDIFGSAGSFGNIGAELLPLVGIDHLGEDFRSVDPHNELPSPALLIVAHV
jgi:hypothetical protein